MAEQVKVQQVEKEQQVKVQEAEINRREKELIATVLKGAEIERQRIETLAAAEKQRLTAEAEGHAASIRAQGEAEAEIIFKKGESEAKAMNVKAEAYQEYNQAAVIDKLFASMPEIVKALASPLANVDKITIVSTGNGDAAGMNKITGDITKMAAQVPALFETLSGMPLSELVGQSPPDWRQRSEAGCVTAKPITTRVGAAAFGCPYVNCHSEERKRRGICSCSTRRRYEEAIPHRYRDRAGHRHRCRHGLGHAHAGLDPYRNWNRPGHRQLHQRSPTI